MKVLRSRLYEMELQRQQSEIASDRRGQVGTGERSEKIRTYNFPQNRLTDHRIGFTSHRLPEVLGRRPRGTDRDRRHPLPVREAQVGRGGGAGVTTASAAGDAAPAPADASALGEALPLTDRVARARDGFARAGVAADEAAADAQVLARHVLGWDRATYLARRRDPAPPDFETRYAPLAARRRMREPVSLITGRREFWGLTFEVGPAVLAPRPETELIVETALTLFGDPREPLTIADVGTGSGCLAVTLAREFPRAAVTAVDVSPDALDVARRNAAAHGVAGRIDWVAAPLVEWLAGAAPNRGRGAAANGGGAAPDGGSARTDLLVANLPYVPTGELASLPPEVRLHEPRTALDGGPDGLDPLRELLHAARLRLNRNARLLVEIGMGQADALRELAAAARGLELLDIRADLQGIPRTAVLAAVRP